MVFPKTKILFINIFKMYGLAATFNKTFNVSILQHTKVILAKIVENYKGFENLKPFVDVSCGACITLSVITSEFPTLNGGHYDLLWVEYAPTYPNMTGTHWRWNTLEMICLRRSLFEIVEELLLKKGNLTVVDAILPMNPDNSSYTKEKTRVDLLLLLNQQSGGKERIEPEFLTVATKAGFEGIRKK
ncbi:hypothetical protein M9H77_06823 [Catharanthus roseus]|uniref:Uncharacterized protein n=1 Tax=Catharanthus roseus TaxID=4058 RepID=A0ACC0BTE1_CATRO|nr:hypothetical protein M9H77_06823 [Catharanthus roseus]